VWWGKLRGTDYLKGPHFDGRVILKWICKKSNGVLDWVDLAENRNRWRALVKEVMNNRVS
jgi:hypothetical protein